MINNLNFIEFVDNYNCAYIVVDFKSNEILYANKSANSLYEITTDTINIEPIFSKHTKTLKSIFIEEILDKNDENILVPDVLTIKSNKDVQITDLHIGYFNKAENQIYLEIIPKTTNVLSTLKNFINQSSKPTLLINLDKDLSIEHCTPKTKEKYHIPDSGMLSPFFITEQKNTLVSEILNHFEDLKNDTFYKHIQIYDYKHSLSWYALSLDKIDLGLDGIKLLCNITCIEEQISLKSELDNLSQYFNALESLCKGLIYRFDIKNRIFYRSPETARLYNAPEISENFPSKNWLEAVMLEDDRANFSEFIDKVATGQELSCDASIRSINGEFEHHRFTFKAIYNNDGTIKEMVGYAMNIHHLKTTEQELSSINYLFDGLQELSDDLLFRINIKTKMLIRYGKRIHSFGLKDYAVLFPDAVYDSGAVYEEDKWIYDEFVQLALQGKGASIEVRMREHENEDFSFRRITWIPIKSPDGEIIEITGKLVDIQELKDLEEKAKYDALTNTLNKRSMMEYTTNILKHSNFDVKHALFFMDLDDFKYANDNLGHIFGDFLLSELGARLRDCIRHHDLVGRVGGDEFVIFLRDIPNIDILMGKAKMILSTISEDFNDGNTHHNIHGSLGIAIYPDHGTTYDELYHHADLALYNSKRNGKNLVTLYSKDLK